jgi:hypothetical protein
MRNLSLHCPENLAIFIKKSHKIAAGAYKQGFSSKFLRFSPSLFFSDLLLCPPFGPKNKRIAFQLPKRTKTNCTAKKVNP